MATSYKIRLKRFNGVDYDTLNLLSNNIIMNTGHTLQSDLVPASNGILKNSSGVFSIADVGTDYGSSSTTITLSANSWVSYTQTITNSFFQNSNANYIVSPSSSSFIEYCECGIYADNVTVASNITFHCETIPVSDITVNVIKVVGE